MLQGRMVAAGCHDEVKCLLVMLPLSRPRVRSLKYDRVVDILCNNDGEQKSLTNKLTWADLWQDAKMERGEEASF